LAIVSALRSNIPAKPIASYKIARWVDTVEAARDNARSLLSLKDKDSMNKAIAAVLKKNLQCWFPLYLSVVQDIDAKHIKVLEGYKISYDKWAVYDAEKGASNYSVVNTNKPSGFGCLDNQKSMTDFLKY
jgi:hypothetical protein